MAEVTLDVDVRDADGRLIVDPSVTIRLASPSGSSAATWRTSFDGQRKVLRLSGAPAGDALILRMTPSRYRDIQIICRVQGDRVLPATDEALSAPKRSSEWLPDFTKWVELQPAFMTLQRALEQSPQFRLGRMSNPGSLIGDEYDAVQPDDESPALAKLSLLNLYSRLDRETAPTTGAPWFDRVLELLLATRERFIAEVDETCFAAVHLLAAHSQSGYSRASHDLHVDNFLAVAGVAGVTDLASVKTQEAKANIQLTVTRAERDGRPVCLLDADIDENGRLLLHAFDLIRHVFTGGTHPVDVHEALRIKFPEIPLGYVLEPKSPIPRVTTRIIEEAAVRPRGGPEPADARGIDADAARLQPVAHARLPRFHVTQDETGYFQLTYENEAGELTLISHQFDTATQLIDDAVEMAESGEFGNALVVVDPQTGVSRSLAVSLSDDRPAPRRAGER